MTSIRMSWRLASRLSVITFAVLVIIIVALVQATNGSKTQNGDTTNNTTTSVTSDGLQGVDLGGKVAPTFQLTDQYGKSVSLADMKGKPVILTFLYTNCPDICPLTAEHLHSTLQALGSDASNVNILAVSTDPKRDTTEAALNFSRQHNMQDSWHYLVGTQEQLSPIWSSYSVYAQTQQQIVNHTSALYLIDKQGHERVFMNGDTFTPSQLAANIKILLKE
ncbi:SCO family protein [Tengunoibacter tsumagoiensis]|uniref:Thioredoxin domain-containing protein n=1 Tax=Tengunoibacter tsumagoiensis TaxID=2014871 RepID=A0A402A5V3_9CHLR|nr:SCO family protein [Tengunoibacter tsumagoiensis]GCE14395.1 hypothetical protein KTT_42540 [Tengunoibacter tsumagoiensis]